MKALELVTRSYFRGGWMLVALLPFAQVLGRAVFNIVGVAYLSWGLVSLLVRRPKLDAHILLHLLTLSVSFGISAMLAEESATAFQRWWTFLLYASVCLPVTAAAIESDAKGAFITASSAIGILTIAYLYVVYCLYANDPGFVPEMNMREDNLPFLLPLMLCGVQYRLNWRHRHAAALLLAILTAAYVILSNGRAALVGLLVGVTAYCVLVLRWRLVPIAVVTAGILAAGFLLRGTHIYRDASLNNGIGNAIDIVSSNRSELWLKAIQHPPANIWFGSGMGNIPESVLEVKQKAVQQLGHFHNFLVDSWYETGFIGAALLLVWIGSSLLAGVRNWTLAKGPQAIYLGALMSASLAILANALFSYSYTSKQFACYLFIYLCLIRLPRFKIHNQTAST